MPNQRNLDEVKIVCVKEYQLAMLGRRVRDLEPREKLSGPIIHE